MAKISDPQAKAKEKAGQRLQFIMPILQNRNCGRDDYERAARLAGVSSRTIIRWVKAYDTEKLSGLFPKHKGSAGICRLHPSFKDALEKAISLRKTDPKISVTNIIFTIESENPDLKGIIKRSTLQSHLQKEHFGKSDLIARSGMGGRKFYSRFCDTEVYKTLQCDVKEFPKKMLVDVDGMICSGYLQTCIDNRSRKIVSFKIGTDQKSHIFIDCLKQAVINYGIPKRLHLDNGAIYKSKQLVRICKLLNIEIKRAKPYAGYEKGVVERLNGMYNDLENQLQALGRMSFAAFKEACIAWINKYNSEPRSIPNEKDMHAPNDFFQKHFVQDPERFLDDQTLRFVFTNTESRKVRKDGTIKLNGKMYKLNQKNVRVNDYVDVVINDDGTVDQIEPDGSVTRINELVMQQYEPRNEGNTDEIQNPRDNSYMVALLREHQRRTGQYTTEEAFQKYIKELFETPVMKPDASVEGSPFLQGAENNGGAAGSTSTSASAVSTAVAASAASAAVSTDSAASAAVAVATAPVANAVSASTSASASAPAVSGNAEVSASEDYDDVSPFASGFGGSQMQ